MILYIGPDQVMPVGSALGALAGLVLIFWNKVVFLVSRLTGRGPGKHGAEAAAPPAADPPQNEEAPRH